MGVLAAALLLAASWRATYGTDLGDGPHAVALAARLARGDRPFVDELNAQVLGAWPAVPFTWAWLRLVGLDGVVLASRIFYVLWAGACALLAWRALAPHVGRAAAAGGLAFAVLPAAYNLQVVSYNTTPALMLLVATAAGVAAWARRSLRWGLVGGVTVTLAAVSHPVAGPAALALGIVLLVVARGRGRLGVLAGALCVVGVGAALALRVWGLEAITTTLSFTQAYQQDRLPHAERLAAAWQWYTGQAHGPWLAAALAAALGAALLSAVPALPALRVVRVVRVARVPLVVAAVVLATVHATGQGESMPTLWTWSWTSPVVALALAILLLPAALVQGVRRRDALLRLLALGLPPTIVGVPVVAALTSSAPSWGAVASVLPPGLLAVGVAVLALAREHGRLATAAVAASLVLSVGLAHTATSYREPPLTDLDARIEAGAFAGLMTTEGKRASIADSTRAVESCVGDGDGLLSYGYPAAHLMADADFDTPIIWLGAFGWSNWYAVDWLERTGREPECIVGARALWPGLGKSVHVRDDDPLLRWVEPRYAPVAGSDAVVVLRRSPSDG